MKTPVLHFVFFALLGLLLSPLTVAHALSPSDASVEDESHPPQLLPCSRAIATPQQAWSPPPAAKRLANLEVGPPRTVRLIYFLPNDRPYRAEVVNKMKRMARRVQTFYAEQMETHGYNRTFRFETDAAGSPKVHRLDGRHPDSYYRNYTLSTVNEELIQTFDLWRNIYIVVIDNSIYGIGHGGRLVGGVGFKNGKNGGLGVFHEEFDFGTMAHELGHAFGLEHNFRDDAYIMSYGREPDQLSACNAGFLAVHLYFNPAASILEDYRQLPTIELISPSHYPAGSNIASVQLGARDSEGLHQVTLFDYTRLPHFSAGAREVKACRGLEGEREAIVEFDYDGVIPSAPLTTSLSMSPVHSIMVEAVDKEGNVGYGEFVLAEISPHHIATLEGHGGRAFDISVAFSPDGSTLVAGLWIGAVRLWDVATKKNTTTLKAMGGVYSLSFSPDGSILATGSGDGAVKLWNVSKKTNIATLKATGFIYSLSFSPDGSTLASGSANGGVRLWDVATKAHIVTLEEPRLGGYVYPGPAALSFSPDGSTLASGSANGAVKLWDVATEKNVATLEATKFVYEFVYSLSFSPDGSTLASGSGDGAVKLWDVATEKNIATLEGHRKYRRVSLSFSPDGSTLASGSGDGAVKLWDVATKKNIATFGATGGISSLSFSPDGAILATGSNSDVVQLWNVSKWTGSLVKTSGDEQQETTTDGQSMSQTLATVSGDGQEGPASTQLAELFMVSVVDQDGSPLAGVDVTFSVAAGGGMLSAPTNANPCTVVSSRSSTTATTDANGRAATRLTLGSDPGTNTVEATVEGLEPVTFTATAAEQATPHSLTKVCGDDQEGTAGILLDEPFVVSVSAEDGAAMAGVVVSFAVTAGGGTLSSDTATTNANGRARAWLTLGSELGTNTVSATVEGLESETFTATGEESPLAGLFDDFLGGGKRVALPDSPQLAQNAPNPFNSQTVLSYFLHSPSPARLEVFALSGQRVAVFKGYSGLPPAPLGWPGRRRSPCG